DFYGFLEEWKPDVVVNDCLDTEKEYMKELKKRVRRVVTIEDVGAGARYADAVINALYEDERPGESYYWGADYVCLRDEFELAQPGVYRERVKQIAVIFGGTDPSNFTRRIYDLAGRIHEDYPDIVFHFIAGSGYDLGGNGIEHRPEQGIVVEQNVKRISEIFAASEIAFTSQGRTVYELAAMGVPAIVLAQNEREMRHTFAQMNNGFLNLGLGSRVSDETIEHTLRFLLDTPQIRSEMRELMLRHNLKKGIDRVIGLILQD
ncbi:MAG: hypothetical protein K2O73_03830, partial [Lachnospiraceae bacterium]|nr:hypothetical protein [Lachnospiraceae bacterium]